jgi:hypothetical protein
MGERINGRGRGGRKGYRWVKKIKICHISRQHNETHQILSEKWGRKMEDD